MDVSEPARRQRASVSAVLNFAWNAAEFRADHVMAALGLTRSTTLNALDRLIDLGLVSELSNSETPHRMGRPPRLFELAGQAGLVVGIDAGDHQITALAADLCGEILARKHLALGTQAASPQAGRQARQEGTLHVIDALLASLGRPRSDVVSVGVGIPAPVNSRGESPQHASGFWQRMNAGLHDLLAAHFPSVRLENDAALAALAEERLGAAGGKAHFVAMLSGHRLGSGVYLEGRLIRGVHGGVGELEALSYLPEVGGTYGFEPLIQRWVAQVLSTARVPDEHPWAQLRSDRAQVEELLASATLDDPLSGALLRELADHLSRVCSVISRFYDPEIIVVCGSMAQALHDVIGLAQEQLAASLELPPPAIVASQLAGDVVALGAVAAARQDAKEIILPLVSNPPDRGQTDPLT